MNNNIKHDTKWHQHTRKLGTQKASYRPEIFPTLLCSLCQICISFPKFSCFPFVSLLSALCLVSFFVLSVRLSRPPRCLRSALIPHRCACPWILDSLFLASLCVVFCWEQRSFPVSRVQHLCPNPACHTAVRDGVAVCERWIRRPRLLLFPTKNSSQVKCN